MACFRLIITRTTGGIVVPVDDIVAFEADGNFVGVHTQAGDRHRLRITLEAVLENVAGHGFARVHRGIAVRMDAVVGLKRINYRTVDLELRGGYRARIGRTELRRLKPLFREGFCDLHELAGSPAETELVASQPQLLSLDRGRRLKARAGAGQP